MKPADDRLIKFLQMIIRGAVRVLSILMTAVIVFGVAEVLFMLLQKLQKPPYFLLDISDILATFGAFMAVLIAIEIFVNITIYLREEIIHVKIVMATALMAIARKVIVFDYKEISPSYVFGTGAVILALSVGYWLIAIKDKDTAGNEYLSPMDHVTDEENKT